MIGNDATRSRQGFTFSGKLRQLRKGYSFRWRSVTHEKALDISGIANIDQPPHLFALVNRESQALCDAIEETNIIECY